MMHHTRLIAGQSVLLQGTGGVSIFALQLAHAIVRQRRHRVIITTGHVVIVDQSVHHGFFACLYRGGEDRVHAIIRHRLH